MKYLYIALVIISSLSSCRFNDDLDKTDEGPVYNKNIAWKIEIDTYGSSTENIYIDGYMYTQESDDFMKSDKAFSRLLKIDLANGSIIWKTEYLDFNFTSNFLKIDKYIILIKGRFIYFYNDDNGGLAATIEISPNTNKILFRHLNTIGPYLFWGNFESDHTNNTALIRLDTRNIDFDNPGNKIQLINTEMLWKSPNNMPIKSNMVVENDIIYFVTANREYNFDAGVSYLVALNGITAQIIWQKELEHIKGAGPNSLVLNEDKLYVMDLAPSCYNKNTGEAIYEIDERKQILNKDYYVGTSSALMGISYYDEKFYYCTGLNNTTFDLVPGIKEEYVNNIVCVDAKNGTMVWGDFLKKGGSNYTFPIIAQGKAFIVTDCGLRVYNADNGKLLGVDTSIGSRGGDVNYYYDGKFIFMDLWTSPLKSTVTAIYVD